MILTIDWWMPIKFLMGAYLWVMVTIGDHVYDRSHVHQALVEDHRPAIAVLYLKSGGALPPGAYFQIAQNENSICQSSPSLGGDAIAVLKGETWHLWFPNTEVGVYIDGPADRCNITMPGSVNLMSGIAASAWRDRSR